MALTSLFTTMINWIIKTENVSDEVWMWVHQKYGIIGILQKLYSIETKKCSYIAFPDYGILNRQNNECNWCSMNVSAPKVWNESDRKIVWFDQNKQSLLPHCSGWWLIGSKKINLSDEVWMWVHQKYGTSWIVWKLYWEVTNKCTYIAINDDGDKTVNVSEEVSIWVHQKYRMSRIVQKLYWIETKNCTYLLVHDDGWLNLRSNECEWWSMNVSAYKIGNELNIMKIVINCSKKMCLPFYSWLWSIESTKQLHWNDGRSQLVQNLYQVKTNKWS